MHTSFTVGLSTAEFKAMQYAALSPQDWIDNVVHNRARIAIDDISSLYLNYRMDNNLGIAATSKDEMVLAAFEEGVVMTIEERNALPYVPASVGIAST